MANTLINASAERTFTYDGIFQYDIGGGDTKQLKFIQDVSVSFDDFSLEIDRIDTGAPFYTRIGDRLGSFSFTMVNSVDLYDTVTPATDDETLSYFIEKIKTPPHATLSMILKLKAPGSGGNQYANIQYGGRVMNVDLSRVKLRSVDEAIVSGDITVFTSALRESS